MKVPEIRDCQNCESLYQLTIDKKIVLNYLKPFQNMMTCRPNVVPTEIRTMEPLGSSVKNTYLICGAFNPCILREDNKIVKFLPCNLSSYRIFMQPTVTKLAVFNFACRWCWGISLCFSLRYVLLNQSRDDNYARIIIQLLNLVRSIKFCVRAMGSNVRT